MKQLIVPIAIIIALIAFFVIIDRKEFRRHDDVQTVQSESPISNRKPMVSVPETKPEIEMNPVVETKPAEVKPVVNQSVAEIKTAETNPAAETKADKPAETTPAVAETEDKHAPAAVPVVTPEEAEKLNEFASFLSGVKTTVVEGEIIERSELPDPEQSDYPNCRFTVHFSGNTIKSGEPCPKEFSLIVEGFKDYHILPNNSVKAGDKVLCSIIPFEELPEDYQSTQQSDDLNLYLLENYYLIDYSIIDDYSEPENTPMPLSGLFFKDDKGGYISIFERHLNPPMPEEIEAAQNNTIRTDLDRITEMLKGYDDAKIQDINVEFKDAWNKEKAKDAPGYNRVTTSNGTYVWRNINGSFWSLPEEYTLIGNYNSIQDYNLQALIAFRDYLHSQGIQFVISIVPNQFDISARVINRDFKNIPDFRTAFLVKTLLENNIEVVYPSHTIIENYNRYPWAFFFPDNQHAADTTQDVLAELIAKRIERFGIEKKIDPKRISFDQHPHSYSNRPEFVWPAHCDIGNNQSGEQYLMNRALIDGQPIAKDSSSPILIIGNSEMQTPMIPESFPTILATKVQTTVDWYRINSIGPFTTIIEQIAKNPGKFLKNKVVVILQSNINMFPIRSHFSNIQTIDQNILLLNGKRKVSSVFPRLSLSEKESASNEGFLTVEFEQQDINVIDIDTEALSLDVSKDAVLRIPIAAVYGTSCEVKVNDKAYSVSESHPSNLEPYDLMVEFPAGTNHLTISVFGMKNKSASIWNIEIYQ